MNQKKIKIHNHIENKVLTDYFFIEGTIDIDDKYFFNILGTAIDEYSRASRREKEIENNIYIIIK